MNSGVTGYDFEGHGGQYSPVKYEDNPLTHMEYLKGLSRSDVKIWLQGYMQACAQMREAFTRVKISFLNALLVDEDNKMLQEKLELLDRYEKMVRDRELVLIELFPDILGS